MDGVTGNPEDRAIAFPQADAIRRGVLHPRKMVSAVWGDLATVVLVAIPSALSPESQTPVSSHMTLVCSALPLPEPRESGCNQDFVCWAFKRVLCLWQTHLSLADRIPANFHGDVMWGASPWLQWSELGSLVYRSHTPQG